MDITAAVALALASVAAYAAAAAMQHRVASAPARTPDATATGTPRPRFLSALLANRTWWMSTAANATGAALHVVALKYGPLTLVQCLGALTVVVAVPLAARADGRRVSRTEWRGTALTLAGFAALLPLTASGGSSGALGTPAALAVAAAAAFCVPVAFSVGTGSLRSLAPAAVSGTVSAAGSALTQTVLHTGDLLSWGAALVAVPTVGLAVGGLFLSQSAYAGGLGAPLAVLTLTNPLVSAVIGLSLLGERVQGGPAGTALALSGAALAARGIVLLSRPLPAQAEAPTAAEVPAPTRLPARLRPQAPSLTSAQAPVPVPVPTVERPTLRPEVLAAA